MPRGGIGKISDGYHTFDDLYRHRLALTAVLFNQNKDKAWKAKKHSDGTMFGGNFICGMETPTGQISYHYDKKDWNKFKIRTLPKAPEWDGHSPNDVVRRLLNLNKGEMQ